MTLGFSEGMPPADWIRLGVALWVQPIDWGDIWVIKAGGGVFYELWRMSTDGYERLVATGVTPRWLAKQTEGRR